MGKNGLERNSSRGRKARERSSRTLTGRRAEPNTKGWPPARNDILPSLGIEFTLIEALRAPIRKLRKHNSAHIRDVASSISVLGFNVPVLIGKGNVVVDGTSRLEAAKLLGLTSVPCIRVDHLDETEQRLLRLAVNRLGEKGAWDPDELEAEFKELIVADAPIEISGFGLDEVDQLIDQVSENGDEAVGVKPTAGSAVSRPGDLFRLGAHRLMCGDATDPAVIRQLMANDVARLVFTQELLEVVGISSAANPKTRSCGPSR